MALGLVLWVLVVCSAVLIIAVFIGMQERRAGGTGRRMQRSLTQAETGLSDALLGWTPGLLGRRVLHPLDSIAIAGPGSPEPIWRGVIQRLNRGLFLVSVIAVDRSSQSLATISTLSRLGWIVRTRPATVALRAALEAGSVSLGDGSRVDGTDSPPPGAVDCPDPDSALMDLLTDGDTTLPAAMVPSFEQLAAQATLVLPGGTWAVAPRLSGGECDVSDPNNWGDPDLPGGDCADYWPVVSVSGNLRVASGGGQGILLVGGDLVIDGSFRFSGLILVRGRVQTGAPNGQLSLAGAMVAGQAGSQATPLSGISITYSKCMISNALQTTGVLIPLRSRSWKQLF